jgi:hypothetical protein
MKSKSPFTKDKSICKIHSKPLIWAYFCEGHWQDEEKMWCEDCKPDDGCVLIDLKREAVTLKDTLRVETRNFAHDIEKIKDLNQKRT